MKNFWVDLPKPIIALAPMAGITDQPFRLICKKFGADVVFSEMVSSEAIYHNNLKSKILNLKSTTKNLKLENNSLRKTLNLIKFSSAEQPFVVQIFGANPEHMAYSAKYISTGEWAKDYLKIKNLKLKIEAIPAGIDLNFGCPAKDIIAQGAGSALMKNHKLASQIIKSVKMATKLPVSVKTRLGWSDSTEILEFSRIIEASGADALTIHGRTYKQGFASRADWEMIYRVKKQLKIPVILNGGVESVEDYRKIELDKIDGVMIGRGSWGRPWIFSAISRKNPNYQLLTTNYQLIKDTILEHSNLVQELKGVKGIIEMRKHLTWYFKGVPNSKEIREKLVKVNTLEEIKQILNKF
ncbi:MAG: tRNA-U20-dihydrouridine synthase [uncultured bacterium]|nr:MAG: tRNA-U20-dihydrouridine synthase [uncultured bacterium]